ncbi:MAG TPA: NAD-binding protein [Candidatus Egerieimonas intestinavium]|uniref:NAD-binding protein n=1 Tax=Candidatus Egerieimonas intestinavium TaxID=2840777 RepID=A0A9D1ELM3_9FIRM|nr:NAD-binding protein [Candidatus Egerieimonas intestinavium]
MKIIIIGCGKVGTALAEQLSKEHYEVVVVDHSLDQIHEVPETIDALRILGNGSSISTLMDAGVDTADILIAVTGDVCSK